MEDSAVSSPIFNSTNQQTMLLSGFNLVHYLLDKGFITYDTFMNEPFFIHMASSRNMGFVVNREGSESLFVKQVRAFDKERTETLRTEATCYWLANHEEEYANLKKFLPRFRHYDYLNHILIIDWLKDSQDLQQFYSQNRVFPPEIARQLASLLASYHKDIFRTIEKGQSKQLFRNAIPGAFLMFGNQLPYMQPRNKAEEEMQQLIRQEDHFTEAIASLQASYEFSSLIHGDIKPNNFLINRDCLETGHFDLRLIDWELADLGDPCWDVAALFQGYLLLWVLSVGAKEQATERPNAFQGVELEEMQPSIQEFWVAYCDQMKFEEEEVEARLIKATRYCGVKLLHSCYESAVHAQQLSPDNARMLQLSFNMLQNPMDATDTLFGIKSHSYA